MREQIEPLLDTAQSITAAPKTVKVLLMARLRQEAVQRQAVKSRRSTRSFDDLATAWQGLLHVFVPARKVAIPVALALVLIIGASFGALNILSPSPALASQCTVSILSGGVEVRETGADNWEQGVDGMILAAGMRIKTAPDSNALLTFFEGSTIKLEPGTDVEIQQLEYTEGQSTTIVLKQWFGRTWSRVTKMVDPGSHYQIDTPSAMAVVRGTQFMTEVDEAGSTTVETIEGLVSVTAQNEEVASQLALFLVL